MSIKIILLIIISNNFLFAAAPNDELSLKKRKLFVLGPDEEDRIVFTVNGIRKFIYIREEAKSSTHGTFIFWRKCYVECTAQELEEYSERKKKRHAEKKKPVSQ